MTLADFTSPRLIIPELSGGDAAAVIAELSEALGREGRVTDYATVCMAALKRELLVATDMQPGMAFPHARLPDLKQLSFALGRSSVPLRWGSTSGNPVRLVFLMAVPEDDVSQYLSLISGLARFAKDGSLAKKLLAAQDANQMFEALRQIPLRASSTPDRLKP